MSHGEYQLTKESRPPVELAQGKVAKKAPAKKVAKKKAPTKRS